MLLKWLMRDFGTVPSFFISLLTSTFFLSGRFLLASSQFVLVFMLLQVIQIFFHGHILGSLFPSNLMSSREVSDLRRGA